MSVKAAANPVELAVAAAMYGGQLQPDDVQTFAATVAQRLGTAGIATNGWEQAITKWTSKAQDVAWRTDAHDLLQANQGVLAALATAVEEVARTPAIGNQAANAAAVNDWLLQHGTDGGRPLSASEIVGNTAFLDKGRFAAYPGNNVPPPTMTPGQKTSRRTNVPIDQSLIADPRARALSDAMTTQWSFLQNRGVEGGDNINSLNRFAYNQHAVNQILDNLEQRGVTDGRVLLVTGYESPIDKLLESDRVKEVVIADLSENAAKVIAEKYAHHPNADKLKITIVDMSGIDLGVQADAARAFSQHNAGEVPADTTASYFAKLADTSSHTRLPFDTGAFDAIHLPFVAGSLHLGPATQAMAKGGGYMDYDKFLGEPNLATPEAAAAATTTMRHVFDESLRMTRDGGLVIANLWARPQSGAPGMIRLCDTPVSHAAFDKLTAGLEHWFSGNPQPTLPHTVGHMFAATKGA